MANVFKKIGQGVKKAGKAIGQVAKTAAKQAGKAVKTAAKAYVATQAPWAVGIFGPSGSPGNVPQGPDPTGRPPVTPSQTPTSPSSGVPFSDAPFQGESSRRQLRRQAHGNQK